MAEKLEKLRKQLEELSITEALDLVKSCEDAWGVSAAAVVGVAAAADVAPVEEKTEFNLILTGAGSDKIAVMKKVRELTQKDLMSAKSFVESATDAAPQIIGTYSKADVEKFAGEFKAIGAVVKID